MTDEPKCSLCDDPEETVCDICSRPVCYGCSEESAEDGMVCMDCMNGCQDAHGSQDDDLEDDQWSEMLDERV